MWLANFEDGSSIDSKSTHWTDLPKEKKLTGLLLFHPQINRLRLSLGDYDRYYFVTEAMAMSPNPQGSVIAEIIGGHDLKLGIGVEVRMEYSGSITIRRYALPIFKYSEDILRYGLVKFRTRKNSTVAPIAT